MACHYIFLKDEVEFYEKLKNRDFELIQKMTKCVLSAAQRKKEKIDIFEITFKDGSSMTFSVEKNNYKMFLEKSLNDYIQEEMYEYCSEIKKTIDKL